MKSLNVAGRFGLLALWFAALTIPLSLAYAQCTRCCGVCQLPPPSDIIYVFGSTPDGQDPLGALVQDAAGNLYGITEVGGAIGNGTVFKLDSNGTETVVHSFGGQPDGAIPLGGLVQDAAGNLYGVTVAGGAHGNGTVFKVDASGNETVLYSFGVTGGVDGADPWSRLVLDSAGNLYGTTNQGGTSDAGTVFKVDPNGNETVLYSFLSGPFGGVDPMAGLVRDSSGNLYGTALGGSSAVGVVFKLDASGNYSVLYNFKGHPDDGANPQTDLILDSAGNLYGSTSAGGSGICGPSGQPIGCGTVFKLDASGKETVLYNFTEGDVSGLRPAMPSALLRDAAGVLHGTVHYGSSIGLGFVFQLDSTGNLSFLHTFAGYSQGDGEFPASSLVLDPAGNLFGTTMGGGASRSGTVFELPPPSPSDFSLTPAQASLNGQPGGQFSDVLTITPLTRAFSDLIQLSCSVSGPSPQDTCAMNPTSVTPGINAPTATLTITTPPASALSMPPAKHVKAAPYASLFPACVVGMTLLGGWRKRCVRRRSVCGVALVLMLAAGGCGSVGGIPKKGPVTYTVTVNATASALQHSTQVSVTVQ